MSHSCLIYKTNGENGKKEASNVYMFLVSNSCIVCGFHDLLVPFTEWFPSSQTESDRIFVLNVRTNDYSQFHLEEDKKFDFFQNEACIKKAVSYLAFAEETYSVPKALVGKHTPL